MPFLLMELPSELFLHVLTRLPLKYLMRLRCVSKFFLDLTNNPDFITSYRSRSSKSNSLPNFNFMETSPPSLISSCKSINQWPWRLHMLFKGSNFIYTKKRHELIPFHCPSTNNKQRLLIGSVNGLVCFGGGTTAGSLEVYNIFAGTNYYLILPIFTPTSLFYKPRDPIFVFGYDPISNDYKILRIEHFYSWIYSFVTNSWKKTTLERNYGTVSDNLEGGRSVCINGVIYWPTGHRDYHRYDDKIVMLDLHIEKFGVIQLPKEDLLLPTQYANIQLLSFRGSLAFAVIKRTSSITRKLIMRSGGRGGGSGGEGEKATSHGDGEIWVELFTLNLSTRKKNEVTLEKTIWKRQSFVVPIPALPKEVEIVSCCDKIFLGWFESNQLRLYNLNTKHIFNIPLSTSPSHYYPKASFMEKKKDNPTYVDNLSFDFSLI